MKKNISWKEIREKYPNEHVVIVNPQCSSDIPTLINSGEVLDHDRDLDTLLNRCDTSAFDNVAYTYTGNLGAIIGERGMVRVIEND